ncbi:7-cyano-7-deazaguanine synthase [Bradyrhizobium yuanmingense]
MADRNSVTCLAWALSGFARVETVGFAYGQRQAIELTCCDRLLNGLKKLRVDWASKLGDNHTLEIPTLAAISKTALTREVAIEIGADAMPNTFVPGRNLIFLTFAAALAYPRRISHIVGCMREKDHSCAPDCRDVTIRALNGALNHGILMDCHVHTPLMWLDKAVIWRLVSELGESRPLSGTCCVRCRY